jgi:small subunit ribosomal protein S2
MARSARQADAGREEGGEQVIGGDEPLADWERELLTGGAEQTTEAPAAEAAPSAEAAASAEVAASAEAAPAEGDSAPQA